jgi:primosomal protein N'
MNLKKLTQIFSCLENETVLLVTPDRTKKANSELLGNLQASNRITIAKPSALTVPLSKYSVVVVLNYARDAQYTSQYFSADFVSIAKLRAHFFSTRLILADDVPNYEDMKTYINRVGFTDSVQQFPRLTKEEYDSTKVRFFTLKKSYLHPVVSYSIEQAVKSSSRVVFVWEKKGVFRKIECTECEFETSEYADGDLKLCPLCESKVRVVSPGVRRMATNLSKKFGVEFRPFSTEDRLKKLASEKFIVTTSKIFKRTFKVRDRTIVILGAAEIFYQLQSDKPTEQFYRKLVAFFSFASQFGKTFVQQYSPNNKVLVFAHRNDYPAFFTLLRKNEETVEGYKE